MRTQREKKESQTQSLFTKYTQLEFMFALEADVPKTVRVRTECRAKKWKTNDEDEFRLFDWVELKEEKEKFRANQG